MTEREIIQKMFEHINIKTDFILTQGFAVLENNNYKTSHQTAIRALMETEFDFIVKMVETIRVRRTRPTQTAFTNTELTSMDIL